MGRRYTAEFENVAVSVAQDLFELVAPADAVVIVHGVYLHQSSEVKDAEEEQLRIMIKRGEGSVTSGSGGSTPTARPVEKGDAAFGGTVEANNTTKMAVGTGAIVNLYSLTWNVRMPFEKIFTPETRPVISPSDRITVELVAAPGDPVTMNGTIEFEEIGG